ncbi:MAG: helix-turn-helix domain-containing protein [Alphaproteobacteria bacterium]
MTAVAERVKSTETVADRLIQARENIGLAPETVAQLIGVTAETYRAWESGEKEPRANRLVNLAGVLRVSAYWILDGGDGEFSIDQNCSATDSLRGQIASTRTKLQEISDILNDMEDRLEEHLSQKHGD